MTEASREALKKFGALANWGDMHPLDMERFWDFVIVAFKNGDQHILFEEFEAVISEYSRREDITRSMFAKYEDGIELLQKFNN
jgi:hypothetical protein